MRSIAVLCVLLGSLHTYASTDFASLYQTKTLVGIRTISYTIRNVNGSIEERPSHLFAPFNASEECISDDNKDLYSDFELITITEEPQNDNPELSKWVEGQKIEGTVIRKQTQLCFASPR